MILIILLRTLSAEVEWQSYEKDGLCETDQSAAVSSSQHCRSALTISPTSA